MGEQQQFQFPTDPAEHQRFLTMTVWAQMRLYDLALYFDGWIENRNGSLVPRCAYEGDDSQSGEVYVAASLSEGRALIEHPDIPDDFLAAEVARADYESIARGTCSQEAWRTNVGEILGCAEHYRDLRGVAQPPQVLHDVYVAEAGRHGHKIGYSVDAEKRISGMQTGSVHELQIVHTIKTSRPQACEQWLHELFADKRLRGEWFSLTQGDLAIIMRIGRWEPAE